MDITNPYLDTLRKNKYLLTFIDHFTTYVEAYLIHKNMCQSICHSGYHPAWYRIHTNKRPGQIIHVYIFHRNMQNIGDLKSKHIELSPSSNGMIKRWHRSLHSGHNHYIDFENMNWDTLAPFYSMSYRFKSILLSSWTRMRALIRLQQVLYSKAAESHIILSTVNCQL